MSERCIYCKNKIEYHGEAYFCPECSKYLKQEEIYLGD